MLRIAARGLCRMTSQGRRLITSIQSTWPTDHSLTSHNCRLDCFKFQHASFLYTRTLPMNLRRPCKKTILINASQPTIVSTIQIPPLPAAGTRPKKASCLSPPSLTLASAPPRTSSPSPSRTKALGGRCLEFSACYRLVWLGLSPPGIPS